MDDLMEASRPMREKNYFANRNHIQVDSIQPGQAACHLDLTRDALNPYGSVHGGALFTLADVCCGLAARSDGRNYITQQASVNFLAGCREGTVTAVSCIRHRGRSTCVAEITIAAGDKTLLIGQMTFFCTDPHP